MIQNTIMYHFNSRIAGNLNRHAICYNGIKLEGRELKRPLTLFEQTYGKQVGENTLEAMRRLADTYSECHHDGLSVSEFLEASKHLVEMIKAQPKYNHFEILKMLDASKNQPEGCVLP